MTTDDQIACNVDITGMCMFVNIYCDYAYDY